MDIKTMKHPDKLTRTILQYPGMTLRLHVKLTNSGNYHFHNSFGNILDINVLGFLTLEVPRNEHNATNKSFMIGTGNIGNVVNTMKKVLKSIYEQPMYTIEDNKIVLSKDYAIKAKETYNIPNLGQGICIIPAVIKDENEITYEGVNIYVNNLNNIIELAISDFENLIYVLEKCDIIALSQLLLNYYISFITDKSLKPSTSYIENNINSGKTISNFSPRDDYNVFSELN